MVTRKGGSRRGSRHILRKNKRERGKISISRYLAKYKEGEKVILSAEPAVQKAMYHRRFHGKKGIIQSLRGQCYEVNIKDGNKIKTLIVHPVHLKRL
ncbi:MAG TPA: 50S ribosomal protein L21e [Candidatus Woesearchaeota archaeon]|nr:MAG: 50S ribosomal protein L21e [Candidatus Woesearchaeota archaeon]HDD70869.1 50S ribosomal protein L21e [Candidatus Woesearchaeota archaeon]